MKRPTKKICKNCLVWISSTKICVLHNKMKPETDTCANFDPRTPEEVLGGTSKQPKKPEHIKGKRGYGNIDIEKLKEMYAAWASFDEIASALGKAKSTINHYVRRLINSGELKDRKEKNQIMSTPKEESTKTDIKESILDQDLQFIRELMDGASKVIIYRRNITVTVELRGEKDAR